MDRRSWPRTITITILILAAAAAVIGCQPADQGSPAPASDLPTRSTQGAASPPEPSVAPSTPPTAQGSGPDMTVTLVGREPIISRRDGPPDRVAVMPAAAAVDADGSVVAFLVWFGPAVGDQVVTVARSADGRTWSVDPDPIRIDLGTALAPPGAIPGAALRNADGTWLLYGWAAKADDRTSFETWRATGTAPEGPWSVGTGEDRVLAHGTAGTWDDETAAVSAILGDGTGFQMWYEGQRAGRGVRGGIGHASSADGVIWTRDDDPVISPGACGGPSAAAALGPQVWRRGDGYLMLFTGSARPSDKPDVLGATSSDGIHWSCSGQVLLSAADIPGSDGIESVQGITLDGEPALLVESLTDGGTDIWLATVWVSP